MHIGIIAPPFEPVPPIRYGGTERVVSAIVEGLVMRGHDVVLFANGKSRTNAELRYIYEEPLHSFDEYADDRQALYAFRQATEFDIIHDHTYLGAGVRYSQLVATPTVITIHNIPGDDVDEPTIKIYRDYHTPLVSISNAQQSKFPGANFVATIYNGVDLNEFQFAPFKDNYMLHIGAISARKGSHIAVEVAHRMNYPLKLAGKIDEWDKPYFEEHIKPFLQPGLIEFVGEVGGQERINLFQRARLLLFPVIWSEPFGLVMIEAMACGTPIIAFNNGAVPEVVIDGETGFIVSSVEEMCDAVKLIDKIEVQNCRDHVVRNFSNEKMVEQYENLYTKIIAQHLNR